MSRRTHLRVSRFALFFALVAFTRAGPVENLGAPKNCDGVTCPGPVKYYQDLGCTPVFKNPTDCCPVEYDCNKVLERSKDKCYANGHEYAIGETLRDEDRNPCDFSCFCRLGSNDVASFVCAAFQCPMVYPFDPANNKCYFKNSIDKCCAEYFCPKDGEERATCLVNGKTYQEGEYFQPDVADPDLQCYCMPGYNGENVEPFCKKPNRPHCDPAFRDASDVHGHCAPVYYSDQNPGTDCNLFSRCQTGNDTIIHKHSDEEKSESRSSESNHEGQMCLFGDMKMHMGDKLNEDDCVSCVCEVPPVPTCKRTDCRRID